MQNSTKQYYSIGEVSKICGVSVQTIRFYSKLNIIHPAYINDETGYRYYTYDQFQLIDRAKYLQKFGFSLQEIYDIYKAGDVDYLLKCLEKQKQKILLQQKKLATLTREISWYCDYFHSVNNSSFWNVPFRQNFDDRYLFTEALKHNESTSDAYHRLLIDKNLPRFKNLVWRFHSCLTIDFKSLLDNKYVPTSCGLFLGEKPQITSTQILKLPAGEYLCFRAKLRTDFWDVSPLKELFVGRPEPSIVIAAEEENHITNFHDSFFQIQILINAL